MVSVVIPLYNKVRHIGRALDSVLLQTDQDFEVIVVDDGSTDGSAQVVEGYTDPRVRLVSREHVNSAGGHAARNRGIAEARADLVAFLDADDEWLPELLETLSRLRRDYPQCGAYATSFYTATGRGRRLAHFAGVPPFPFEGVIPNYFRTVHGDHAVCSSAVAVPKRVFDVCGLFPDGEQRRGDLDMWCRIALRYPIAYSTRVGAIFHKQADNRVTRGGPVLVEPRIIRTLEGALAAGVFPAGVARADLLEYRNAQLVSRALSIMWNGQSRKARELLREAAVRHGGNGACRRAILLSYLPTPLARVVVRVRNLAAAVRIRAIAGV